MFIVATNAVASRPTGTPHARAKIISFKYVRNCSNKVCIKPSFEDRKSQFKCCGSGIPSYMWFNIDPWGHRKVAKKQNIPVGPLPGEKVKVIFSIKKLSILKHKILSLSGRLS